jgi:hypothetical protein
MHFKKKNDYLDVPRSLSLPLEPHNPQRHVVNCAAWFGKEQNIDAKSVLRKTDLALFIRHLILPHTLFPRDLHLVFTQHTRVLALLLNPDYRLNWRALSRHSTRISSALNSHFPFS